MSRQFRSDDTSKWTYGFGNGSDGDLTISGNTTETVIDSSCTGTAGQYSLSATNASFAAGQAILIHKSRGSTTVTAGEWELNYIASYSAGTITTALPLQFSYNDSGSDQSQVRVMKQYNNVTINSGVTLTGKTWDQNVGGILAFFAKSTTITGGLSSYAIGFRGGPPGSPDQNGYCGEGSGTDIQKNVSDPDGNGGGARNVSTAGGGNATTSGTGSDGTYGTSDYVANLTRASFGGGGGGGSSSNPSGSGGKGSGFIIVVSKTITVTGTVSSNGGNAPAEGASNGRGGSGGAGGCILFKCQTATLGTNLVTAGGGAPYVPNAYCNNNYGSVGRIHLDYKTSYTGTTNPTLDHTQDATLDYPAAGGAFLHNLV